MLGPAKYMYINVEYMPKCNPRATNLQQPKCISKLIRIPYNLDPTKLQTLSTHVGHVIVYPQIPHQLKIGPLEPTYLSCWPGPVGTFFAQENT